MFLLDWQLALITLVTAPIIGFLVWLFRRFARDQYREMRKKIARLNSYLNESIQGMRTILMFHKQDYCQEQFRIRNAEYRDTSIATVRIFAYGQMVAEHQLAFETDETLWQAAEIVWAEPADAGAEPLPTINIFTNTQFFIWMVYSSPSNISYM